MIYTLFANPELAFSPAGANPIPEDVFAAAFPFAGGIRHNVLYMRQARFELASGATAQLRVEGVAASDWLLLVCRVVGTAKLVLPGLDWDGVTAISGVIPAYGTALYPGFAVATWTNANGSPTIQATADGTIVDAFSFVLAADDDVRLADNA